VVPEHSNPNDPASSAGPSASKLQYHLEAVKLTADWIKWIVVVETALLAANGFLLRDLTPKPWSFSWTASGAGLFSFIVSILAATVVLGTLPNYLTEFDTERGLTGADGYWTGWSIKSQWGMSVGWWTKVQVIFFVLGLAAFGLAIVCGRA
jgi:hypothetical protein